jgi:hypothetical protein
MYSRKIGDKLRAKAPWSYAVREDSYWGYTSVVVLDEDAKGMKSIYLGDGLARVHIRVVKTCLTHDIVWRWSDGRKLDWRPCGRVGCTCHSYSQQVDDMRRAEAKFDLESGLEAMEPVHSPRDVVSKRGIKCDGYLAVARTYVKRMKREAKVALKPEERWRVEAEAVEARRQASLLREHEESMAAHRKMRRQWKLAKKMDFKRDWKLLAVYHTISSEQEGALELARSLELSGG